MVFVQMHFLQQQCIPVGCVPPACCPYLPACTAPGGCTWSPGGWGVPGLGGCTWSQGGVPGRGGVYLVRGCTWSGGHTWSWGVYLVWGCTCPGGGGYLPRYSPPVNRMTNRCKNISLPQTSFAGGNNRLLKSVINVQVSAESLPIACATAFRNSHSP